MAKAQNTNAEDRRKDILDAALSCFLNFGYSKTSMDDVAKKAGISRPLIYVKFKNKEDLLLGLFDHIMEGRLEQSEEISSGGLSKLEKLTKIVDVLKIEPWARITGGPMSQEFFETCCACDEKSYEKFEKNVIKVLTEVLGDRAESEVFLMAMNGCIEDVPSATVLKKRLDILIEKFSK